MSAVAERTALDAAHAVVSALGDAVEAAYAIGSVATGGFVPGTSDLDVVVVLHGDPSRLHHGQHATAPQAPPPVVATAAPTGSESGNADLRACT